MLLTFQQRLYPEWAQTRRRGCVKLGVPGNLGATSCVSRRVSERRTPWVPQRVILGVLRSNEKKTNSRTTHSEIKKMKKKIKIGERKKNSHSRYGNTTQHTTLTSRNGRISGALAPHTFPCANGAHGVSARPDRRSERLPSYLLPFATL